MSELDAMREWFATEVVFRAGVEAPRLERAFATVPRERFLGPPPWTIFRPSAALAPAGPLQVDQARMLYHNVLVAIDLERRINNGEPSSLAMWIHALDLQPGEHVVHIGCGVGYYTAILAEVVGPEGRVTAIEVDPGLAERARSQLADRPNVEVITGDGADIPDADALFVNAGCTHPRREWLARIRAGGRICMPLTLEQSGRGATVVFTRHGASWRARVVSTVSIFPCEGARDPEENDALLAFFRAGPEAAAQARVMRLDPHEPGAACLLHTARYCLGSEDGGA